MRLRPHVQPLCARLEMRRPHVVEKREWPNHAVFGEGQDAAHLEPAQVLALGVDDQLNHLSTYTAALIRFKAMAVVSFTPRITMWLSMFEIRPKDSISLRSNSSKARMSRVITRSW